MPATSHTRTKLKPSEAALLAGELKKPSWQSKNEGIHERVSFEDSIWGFDLAGGSFYKTPLRVTAVKPESRAEKAGIRPGDKLLRINDIDTSTLTIQEAHEIIIESGVHLRLAVTAPEDEEDSYHCWEDAVEEFYDPEAERRKQEELEARRRVHAKVSSYWSLQWPWVSKRRIIYKESNCFMVPSKYESKHSDKFGEHSTALKTTDEIVLFSNKTDKQLKHRNEPENNNNEPKSENNTETKVENDSINMKNDDNHQKATDDANIKSNINESKVEGVQETPVTPNNNILNDSTKIETNDREVEPREIETKADVENCVIENNKDQENIPNGNTNESNGDLIDNEVHNEEPEFSEAKLTEQEENGENTLGLNGEVSDMEEISDSKVETSSLSEDGVIEEILAENDANENTEEILEQIIGNSDMVDQVEEDIR